MIKNKIKTIKLGFLIVCILPTFSYALDKEDILEYLVKSSYPEVKVIDDEDNIKIITIQIKSRKIIRMNL